MLSEYLKSKVVLFSSFHFELSKSCFYLIHLLNLYECWIYVLDFQFTDNKSKVNYYLIRNVHCLDFRYWLLKIRAIFSLFCISDQFPEFSLRVAIKMLEFLDLNHSMSINNLNMKQFGIDFLCIYLFPLRNFKLTFLISVMFNLWKLLKMGQ